MITLKDIYSGRPDASEEIAEDGYDNFIESFILPPNFDLKSFLDHGWHFISGYKGTGKSALLWYIKRTVESNFSAITDFLSFKRTYTETKKNILSTQAKKIGSVLLAPKYQQNTNDYESIWKWELFKKINEINGQSHSGIFENNQDWKEFKGLLKAIDKDTGIGKWVINPQIAYESNGRGGTVSVSGIIPTKEENTEAFEKFESLLEQAEAAFNRCKRTNRSFYLFIDELEAYNGQSESFRRDLEMIRDLIIVVRQLNKTIRKNSKNSLLLLALRTEVKNAINREIISKEINKVLGGFEYNLRWHSNDSSSIYHPIFQILLRRIQLSELKHGIQREVEEIYKDWFPIEKSEQFGNRNIVAFIVDSTWNKPRDIVNMLTEVANLNTADEDRFTPSLFNRISKEYSRKCQEEIREELLSVYSVGEIDSIFQLLQNFKISFSSEDFAKRISKCSVGQEWNHQVNQLLNNLYRIGVIGNYSRVSQMYRWCYRGDETPLFDDEWVFTIHRSLLSCFSIYKRHQDAVVKRNISNQKHVGKIVPILVKHIDEGVAFVELQLDGKKQTGVLFKSKISSQYVKNISDYLWEGEETEAKIEQFDEGHGHWQLTLVY